MNIRFNNLYSHHLLNSRTPRSKIEHNTLFFSLFFTRFLAVIRPQVHIISSPSFFPVRTRLLRGATKEPCKIHPRSFLCTQMCDTSREKDAKLIQFIDVTFLFWNEIEGFRKRCSSEWVDEFAFQNWNGIKA